MFRLVKVLNSNNQCEVSRLKIASAANFGPGCALTCSSGSLSSAAVAMMPDYISMVGSNDAEDGKIDAMFVTEDMVFKVEFTGTTAPYPGMTVGLSTKKQKMDSVTHSTTGKGMIIAVDDNPNLVYVRFRR